ncbi:hypothetical protein EYF80_022530 [Liparis tanakae]|uniref:RGS domain-containing protein n=1 Tax=Liparis tanakae TaxID=230148 RepID=A0A4Z2HNY7_9TELE|nr:hypothetical protein EYF80_022530 [Liparis tanakae]
MEEDQDKKASKILSRYMEAGAECFCPFLTESGITKVKEKRQESGDDLCSETTDKTMDFLKLVPYTFFPESMHLKRCHGSWLLKGEEYDCSSVALGVTLDEFMAASRKVELVCAQNQL